MFVAVGGILAVVLIVVMLSRGHLGARMFFGGVLCLLGLLTFFVGEGWFMFLLAIGQCFYGVAMISSATEAGETRKQQSGEWVVRRQQLRDALASETEPGKIALLKHDLERHEANAPDESHIREALAAEEEKKTDGARGN